MGQVPVVLVHGWNGWPDNWRPIRQALAADGYPVYLPHVPVQPLRATIRADATRLQRYLERSRHAGGPGH